jgi:hypothetical protein
MSSYFDEASLVMIPSGYKDQKLYSVKPLSGDGDLTFSRASSATRVASNGLIEKVRTNLFTYSQLFSNAAWTKTGLTLTGSQTDPNGGTTAFLATATATSSSYFYQSTTTAGCVSVYAKAGTRSKFSIINGLFAQGAEFDLATQTTIVSGAGSLAKIESVGGGWFRCSVFLSSITDAIIALDEVFGGGVVVGQTMSFAFAQHETGDIATDYIATTTAAVSVGPVSGLPRLDYLNSSCPRLLLEPQRTSNVQFSEAFDNAYWTKDNVTLTSTLGGPIDQSKYFTITCNGTTGRFKGVVRTFINASPNTYTLSVFAKAGNSSTFVVSSRATLTTNDVRAIFNLSNGTITNTNGGTAAIVPYGDGWYRCSFTVVNAGTFTNEASIFFGHPHGAADGATVLATGAMSETGAYATSYIPTLSTSVTRVADAASKTGISSLIGQTEGTLFADITLTSRSNFSYFVIAPNIGSTSAYVGIGITSSAFSFEVVNSGVQVAYNFPNTSTGNFKIAFAYKANDFVAYVNGVQVHSDTSGTVPACSQLGLNTYNNAAAWNYNQALLFKTRLTNAQLAELTTL